MSELKTRTAITFEPNSGRNQVAKALITQIVTGERSQLTRMIVLSFLESDHLNHSLVEAVSTAANLLKIDPHRTIWFAHLPRVNARERYELVTFNWSATDDGQLVVSTPVRAPINPTAVHQLFNEFSPPAEAIRIEQLFYNARSAAA